MEPFPSSKTIRAEFQRLGSLGSVEPETYALGMQLGHAFVSSAQDGTPSLLIPMCEAAPPVTLRSRGLSVSSAVDHRFLSSTFEWIGPTAVIRCTDGAMLDVFSSLVRDVADRVARERTQPTWHAVRTAVRNWQRLLDRVSPLTAERQLGLWGELSVIRACSDVDTAVATWRGATRSPVDFVGGGIAVECKASMSAHRHWVSTTQMGAPAGAYPTYFVSLCAIEDPVSGESMVELVHQIASRLGNPEPFWQKLLEYGYAPQDEGLYGSRLALRDEPRCFLETHLPRVHQIDPEVLEVRYRVDLGELEENASLADILARLTNGGLHEACDAARNNVRLGPA